MENYIEKIAETKKFNSLKQQAERHLEEPTQGKVEEINGVKIFYQSKGTENGTKAFVYGVIEEDHSFYSEEPVLREPSRNDLNRVRHQLYHTYGVPSVELEKADYSETETSEMGENTYLKID
ncbi:MAG: hypothetical protein ABEJ95_02695 [Candidatus Nanohalobium sp.]